MARRVVDIWRQGELDGLCGIYAIINAMKLLAVSRSHAFSDYDGAILFREMVKYLHNRNLMPNALWDGTSIQHVRDFLHTARRFMRKRYQLEIVHKALARKGEITRKDVFWRVLDSALANGPDYNFKHKTEHARVALLGLGWPQPHWTLAYGVSKKTIHLIDSGSHIRLSYARSTLGVSMPGKWMIEPEHTIVIPPCKPVSVVLKRRA